MKPYVGQIVHYISYGSAAREDETQAFPSQCRAAIVAAVPKCLLAEPMDGCPNGTEGEWLADIVVFNPTGLFFQENLPLDSAMIDGGGHWHYLSDCGSGA